MIEIPMPPEGIDCTARWDDSEALEDLVVFIAGQPSPEKIIEFFGSEEGAALWNSKKLFVPGRQRLEVTDKTSEPVFVFGLRLNVEAVRAALRAREG